MVVNLIALDEEEAIFFECEESGNAIGKSAGESSSFVGKIVGEPVDASALSEEKPIIDLFFVNIVPQSDLGDNKQMRWEKET